MSRQSVGSLRIRRRALLESYVAPEIVAHILSNGRVPLPSGVRIPVTVLFADIRNFTRFAATLPAKRVVAFLDDYFEAMTGAAAAYGAAIDKLIGDAVMVVFGVPRPVGSEAERAICAATAMHAAFAAVLARWRRSLPTTLRLGLGIGCATGEVVLANVGSPERMDYTVIGESVNLAARLTSLAGDGVTLVSRDTRNEARRTGGTSLRFGRMRRLIVKGIPGPVVAYPASTRVPHHRAAARRMTTDPVCGMKLPIAGALIVAYRGRTYQFCSHACQASFRRNPAQYAGAIARPTRRRTVPR